MILRTHLILPLLFLATIAAAATPQRRHAAVPPVAETSEDLIADAVQHGEIDADTALMYRVFADFGDPRLPDRFKGTVPPDFDSTAAAEAVAQWDSLPASVQEAIAPFLVPPFQKGSWADKQSPLRASSVHANDIAFVCGDVDNANWDSVASITGDVRVWWMRIHPEDERVALALAGQSVTILQQYTTLLGRGVIRDGGSSFPCRGGDDAIDVALADDITTSKTIPFGRKSASSFVLLKRGDADGPEATLAHELFHVMQFTYNVSGFAVARDNYHWLMEATAQWAMDYHQRPGDSGKEQRAASLWLDRPDLSLTYKKNYHEYGGYLFFLYLSRTYGDSIIKTIWDATESHDDAASAVDSAIPGGFKERWPEFAADAWNHAPLDKFNQWDQLTGTPATQSGTLLSGAPDAYVNVSADLPSLSARYIYVTFDSNVHSIGFLNGLTYDLGTAVPPSPINFGPLYKWSDASDDAKRGAMVQIIVKKNGQWQAPEPLSDTKIKAFCQDNASEKIDELVLVITNSDTDENRTLKSPDLDSQLIVTNIGCGQFSGTNSFTSNEAAVNRVGHMSEEFDLTYTRDDSSPIADTQPGYRYKSSGHASYTISGNVANQPCRYQGHDDNAGIVNLDGETYNFVPRESAVYRKARFPVLLQQPAKFQMICPGVDPIDEDASTVGAAFPPPADFSHQFIDIKSDGTTSGEQPDEFGTWKWNFTPK
jgi:hypothetical protein